MTFIDNYILVLEKNSGKVIRINENGVKFNEPVLDVAVGYPGDTGLLGIESTDNHVYLHYTKSCKLPEPIFSSDETEFIMKKLKKVLNLILPWTFKWDYEKGGKYSEFGPSNCPTDDMDKHTVKNTKNSIYQYDWNGQKLTNPVLLKELPSINTDHHGGIIVANGDDEIYFVNGDNDDRSKLGYDPVGSSLYGFSEDPENKPSNDFILASILKINNNEKTVEIFATGVRNSFGLAIDPLTGNLWDTENGFNSWDEINLVKHGFNSGWPKIMGPNKEPYQNIDPSDITTEFLCNTCEIKGVSSPFPSLALHSEDFVYSDPEFSFMIPVGITSIAFPDNNGFEKYSDWLFVGDFNNGRIYKFHLNEDRTGFVFSSPYLSDLVLDTTREITDHTRQAYTDSESALDDDPHEILFAEGIPGGVVDIKFHGNAMYVVSIFDGTIYKISPK